MAERRLEIHMAASVAPSCRAFRNVASVASVAWPRVAGLKGLCSAGPSKNKAAEREGEEKIIKKKKRSGKTKAKCSPRVREAAPATRRGREGGGGVLESERERERETWGII
jgi:hypothetical protein